MTPADQQRLLSMIFNYSWWEWWTTFLWKVSPIREAMLGYRALLIAGGVSDLCADEMVVQFHGFTLALIQQASPA